MSTVVLENALQSLLPGSNPPFPKELIELSNTLISQSRVKVVGLRPDEEVARTSLCCYLAIEILKDNYNLPPPSTKKAPIPPKSYQKLVVLFRNSLNKRTSTPLNPSTPKKQSPLKRSLTAESPTPKARLRLNLTTEQNEDRLESTPPTPSPIKRRGLAKETDPTPKDLYRMATGLEISQKATEAINHGYKKYNNLVKDRWGLLCGLFYVICSRAHPQLLLVQRRLETLIMSYAGDKSRMNDDKMSEWIIWADKILADQSWIREITVSVKRRPIGDSSRRKHSSGIGNMITFGYTFTSERRLKMYDEWKDSILKIVEDV